MSDDRSAVRSDAVFEALVCFAEGLASCPCCEGVYACEVGCTIKEDSRRFPESLRAYEIMMAARDALHGGAA